MGSHGAGRVADVMMGSTAGRVLRRSKKPVLIVRHPEETDWLPCRTKREGD